MITRVAIFLIALAVIAGCNPFVAKQQNAAVLTTSNHKTFSLSTEIDSGTTWASFRILPRLGSKKTDIVLPELKDKPCDISVSVQEAASACSRRTYAHKQCDFGESHPIFPLIREKKNKVDITIVFDKAIQTNITFDVILFADPEILLP
ncbi:MAG: hypothetical protein ACOX9C_03345 [Kiritimatiellia bacterium]|jgi:hypothetical protein